MSGEYSGCMPDREGLNMRREYLESFTIHPQAYDSGTLAYPS